MFLSKKYISLFLLLLAFGYKSSIILAQESSQESPNEIYNVINETVGLVKKAAEVTAHKVLLASEKTAEKIIEKLTPVQRAQVLAAAETSLLAKRAAEFIAFKIKNPHLFDSYEKALEDSRDASPQKIQKVNALAPWNKNLTWNDKGTHIRMVSWIPDEIVNRFYRPVLQKEEPFITPINSKNVRPDEKIFLWTTYVPEMKSFINKYANHLTGSALHIRITQLLGLPPGDNRPRSFVELWVKPEDLFRPCLNSDILEEYCIPDPHIDMGAYRDLFRFLEVTSEYKAWFEAKKKNSYTGAYPFPWTRLGYTYDWANNTDRGKIGMTEFIVKEGKEVKLKSIIPTDQYK